ncbi:hypothetical protein ES703_43094 [subsurface metagenome]
MMKYRGTMLRQGFAGQAPLPPSLSFFAKATKEPATEGRQGEGGLEN